MTKNIVGISARDVHIVVFSGLGIAILSMLLRCGWSLLLAADRQFVGDLSVNATFVTEGLASLAIVACGGTPVVLAVSLVVMRFAWVCVVFALGAKHGPWIWSRENLSVGSITQAIRNLWRPATGYFADPLSNVLQTQGSVFLVGYLLGPALAPVVYSHRLLTRVAWQLSGGVRSTTNGELVRLFAVGDRAGLRKYGLLIISVYMWVALLCFFGLAILGPFVMKIWVRDKSIFDPILFELFVLSVPFSGILYGAKAILAAENDHYQLSRTELVFTIIAFLAMVGMLLLTQELWIVGLAMAVLSILLYFVSLNHLARKMDSTPYAVATAAVTALPSVAWSRSVYQYRKFSERKLRPR